MNLQRTIKTIRGQEYQMTFVTEFDIEKVKTEKGITEVKNKDLPRETVQNVLINCLLNYSVKSPKEILSINKLSEWVMGDGKTPLPEDLKNILIKHIIPASVDQQDDTEGKNGAKGIYKAWVLGQVLDELGANES